MILAAVSWKSSDESTFNLSCQTINGKGAGASWPFFVFGLSLRLGAEHTAPEEIWRGF